MSVTHAMADVDAVGCFPKWRHWKLRNGVEGQMDPPTVKWIVVAEPLVCGSLRPVCNRIGPGFGKPDHRGCPDCNGTGLPDVQIVGVTFLNVSNFRGQLRTPHGIVAIGPAVLIVDTFKDHVFLLNHNPVPAGEFGTQSVTTPNMWAHPVLQATP